MTSWESCISRKWLGKKKQGIHNIRGDKVWLINATGLSPAETTFSRTIHAGKQI